MNKRMPGQALENPLRDNTQKTIEEISDKRLSFPRSYKLTNKTFHTVTNLLTNKRPLKRQKNKNSKHKQLRWFADE